MVEDSVLKKRAQSVDDKKWCQPCCRQQVRMDGGVEGQWQGYRGAERLFGRQLMSFILHPQQHKTLFALLVLSISVHCFLVSLIRTSACYVYELNSLSCQTTNQRLRAQRRLASKMQHASVRSEA